MNAQTRCEEIISKLVDNGFVFQVSKAEVAKAIMMCRGVDLRTQRQWIKTLELFEYLKPVSLNLYEINVVKVPQLLPKITAIQQTKIL